MSRESLKEIVSYPYQLVHAFKKELFNRDIFKQKRLVIPVISVGNISFGGTGKTPFTIHLARTLVEKYKKNVCILTRAYKSKIPKRKIPLYIKGEEAKKYLKAKPKYFIGDEPILILENFINQKMFSMAIGSKRYDAAQKALKKNPKIDLFILDDGMQHLDLYKDFEIALVNVNETGFYRESPDALRKVNQVIYSKVDEEWLSKPENKDKVSIRFKLDFNKFIDPDKKILAISGLADNDSFFHMLRKRLELLNYKFKSEEDFETVSLPDHYSFSQSDIDHFIKKQNEFNLICTAKDYVKIPEAYNEYFIVAELELELHNEVKLFENLENAIVN